MRYSCKNANGSAVNARAISFMRMGTQRNIVSEADGCPARRVGKATSLLDTYTRPAQRKYATNVARRSRGE